MFYRMNGISREPFLSIVYYLLAGGLVVSLWWGLAELSGQEKNRAANSPREKPGLTGALRAGSPEFEWYRGRIAIGQPQVMAVTVADDLSVKLIATVRNHTGRVIKGLEVRGMVADSQGRMSEQVAVIIPTQQTVMEPNEAIKARLLLADVRLEAPTDIRVEVTGVIFD